MMRMGPHPLSQDLTRDLTDRENMDGNATVTPGLRSDLRYAYILDGKSALNSLLVVPYTFGGADVMLPADAWRQSVNH
jgi:hypothetical protein